MTTKVFFYLLNERFVENDEQVPEQSKTGDVLLFGDWSPCWRN